MSGEVVLQAVDLKRYYEVDRGTFKKPATLKALDGASFTLKKGKTLAIVGESGCGKSTMARLVTMIETPTSGQLIIGDEDVSHASRSTRSRLHKKVQIVFQDPYGSLNPRQKIGHSLEEPLLVNTSMKKAERREAALKMIRLVGLRPEHYDRYPHMFSGGQRQRICRCKSAHAQPRNNRSG